MNRIALAVESTRSDLGTMQAIRTGKRQDVLRNWTSVDLLLSATTAESTKQYLMNYFDTQGQAMRITGTGGTKELRAIAQMRTGSFFFWPRRRHLSEGGKDLGCAACGGIEYEDANHVFLTCPRWEVARRELLQAVVQDGYDTAQALLGGRGSAPSWIRRVLPQVLLFLRAVLQERERAMEEVQARPTPSA